MVVLFSLQKNAHNGMNTTPNFSHDFFLCKKRKMEKKDTSLRESYALLFNPSGVSSLPVAPTNFSPLSSTLGILALILSFSCSSTTSSSSSSSSLLSSLATLLLTNLHAILKISTNQKTLTACRAKSRENVIICEIQHLYCWVSQLSSKGPTVRKVVRTAQRMCRFR